MSDGFRIEYEVLVEADPDRLFVALVDVGAWWTRHFSDAPAAVLLEPQPGGRFYEEFGESGGGAWYGTVAFIEHRRRLRIAGPLGIPGPVTGDVLFDLEPEHGGTRLKLTHRVHGPVDAGMEDSYRRGWEELLGTNLKRFAEAGAMV